MGSRADSGTESFGVLLRHYRGRMGLTQEELAERAGLHAQEISQLERGVVRRPRSTTVEFLADALKLDAQEREAFFRAAWGRSGREAASVLTSRWEAEGADGRLGDAEALLASMPTDVLPPHAPLPAGSRMPLAPNPLFVGRGGELLQVAAALKGGTMTVALGQVVASTGLGGLGKTQLAVELVHRYGRFFAGGVYWLSFASADEVPLQVAACAGPGLEARPLEERVQRVKDAWQSAVPRLLVFDNCEEEWLLETWRPVSGGCRVLVTSRRSHWSPTLGVTALPLDLLPRADSVALLRKYRPDLAADDPGLGGATAELGDLPLALHLAGSYLRAYGAEVSLDDYLAELRQSEVVQHASLLGAGLDDSVSPTRHVQSVAQTFALCLGCLDREREVDRVAIALLARMACMAPGEPVPRDLLGKTLEEDDPLLRADGIRRMGAVGLVEEGADWLRLHRLLAHFVRKEGLDPSAQSDVDRVLIHYCHDVDQRRVTGAALMSVITHLVHVANRHTVEELRRARLCNTTGVALLRAGDFGNARPWLERGLAIHERVLGPEDPSTATSLMSLAVLFKEQGRLAAARSLLERALVVRETRLGPDHPETAAVVNNLANVLAAQGEVEMAKNMHKRALAIRERVFGPDDPQTAKSIGNLAELLMAQGELAAARPLCERTLSIFERVLGPEHHYTALALNNCGRLFLDMRDLECARPLLERALGILEGVLGPNHPDICPTLDNLGRLRRAQAEVAAARPLFERALAIRERAFGPDHSHTATSLNDLALLLREQADPAAARPLLERALAVRERVLGPDHPDTVATRRALEELAGDGAAAGG